MLDVNIMKYHAKVELARREFFWYCNLLAPDFYKPERTYLVELCEEFQSFYESEDEVLIINLPPRMGKSRTATLFAQWMFGKNKHNKIMTGSYNETLSTVFSKSVRNSIQEIKANELIPVFSDVFPNVEIKRGDGSMNMWSLEGGHNNYLATSPNGTSTGFGANCFPAGTMIQTDIGEVDIEDIYNCDKNNIRVLSYDQKDDIVRYNKIQVKRRSISNELIEIKTNTGRTVTATRDHRFYTEEHGYIEAGKLTTGDTLKTCEIQRKMRGLWRVKKRKRKVVSSLLRQTKNDKNRLNMFLLSKGISSIKVSARQSHQKRFSGDILFKRMFLQGKRFKAKNEKMCDLRRICIDNKILFSRMQENRHGSFKKTDRYRVSNLPCSLYKTLRKKKILLNGVQKQGTFDQNEGDWKLALQERSKLFKRIYRYKTRGKKARQLLLSELWRKRKGNFTQNWASDKSCSSSYRRNTMAQRNEKPNNALQIVSHKITQNEKVKSKKKINGQVYVYDLQVERDNNFFANNILVHNCMLIDDLIKNSEEAFNELTLEKHYQWFTNTMLSRLEEKGKIIIIMTRWSNNDLAGKSMDLFKDRRLRVFIRRAMDENGEMLCSELLSKQSYLDKIKAMSEEIASANYQQIPINLKGTLYKNLKTYTELPKDSNGNLCFTSIKAYCDTADEGSDYLCNIIYGEFQKQVYIIDVYYTKDSMEITELEVAKRLSYFKVNVANIESNNGGRGFSRNVKDKIKDNSCVIQWFHQSKNKKARILTASAWVQENIFFPVNWRDKWSVFYKDVVSYQKAGKNKHDDCADALSGIYDKICAGSWGWK